VRIVGAWAVGLSLLLKELGPLHQVLLVEHQALLLFLKTVRSGEARHVVREW